MAPTWKRHAHVLRVSCVLRSMFGVRCSKYGARSSQLGYWTAAYLRAIRRRQVRVLRNILRKKGREAMSARN